MKKIFVVVLALFLAIPAISCAGSATSRWDLMIGGDVQFDMGWADRGQGTMSAGMIPGRDGSNSISSKYGNWLWGGGQTQLDFGVRGPDAWGAKTSAFILGDFTGIWGGSSYGTFDLMIASMSFDWPNTNLTLGQTAGLFGMPITFTAYTCSWGTFPFGEKGPAPVAPQVTLAQKFGQNWTAAFGVMENDNIDTNIDTLGPPPNSGPTSYNRSPIPGFQGQIEWHDKTRKIGPWQLAFDLDGFWSQEKRIYVDTNGDLTDDQVNMWFAEFKWMVPVIPEKNPGNKKGALLFDGGLYTGQNMGTLFGSWGSNGASDSYARPSDFYGNSSDPLSKTLRVTSFASPVSTGFIVHLVYYFTDQVYLSGFYDNGRDNNSQAFRVVNPNSIESVYQYVVDLGYDVSPAIKILIQWDHTRANYAGYDSNPLDKKVGTANDYRLSAYYYF